MTHPAYDRLATIIRMAGEGCSDDAIAEALNADRVSISRTRNALDIQSGQSVRNRAAKEMIKRNLKPEIISKSTGLKVSSVRRIRYAMGANHG